jgi:iron complex transport system substrate-binding protein
MSVATRRFCNCRCSTRASRRIRQHQLSPSRAIAADGAEATNAAAPRILSLSGDVTEILYDLGQSDKVVAVDTTSQFPASALKEKKSVGYLRALSAEGMLSVNPTLIIASEQAGPPEVVKALKSSGVRYVDIADKPTAEGVPDKVTTSEALSAPTTQRKRSRRRSKQILLRSRTTESRSKIT